MNPGTTSTASVQTDPCTLATASAAESLVSRGHLDGDDGIFCARHDRRIYWSPSTRQQCDAQSLLGVVVAGVSVSLRLCRAALVCRLPLHDRSRMDSPVLPLAVSASATHLEYPMAKSLGSLDLVWWLCAQAEGILSGISTGAAVYAGLHIGQRSQYQNQRIVIIQPSVGERYLSTAMWHEIRTENASQTPPTALSHG